jgi:hypothetical protein
MKSDICAEVKSDMSKIRADLIIQVHALENKMGNYMRVIMEELETQIGDLCAGQAELEERLDKQQENVASMVEQHTCERQWRHSARTRDPISSCGS